ncbi:uncharacterized protein LY79DRAFT_579384 [Colletotrichum navitas]|uniref:Uncharacterized protein n=1 Tax=Colletotrichum navitas TaxID=681940 RepID=A0AAD8Q009_9PEZI|nr:uncharacterized protein LY79DRAFT_579384 [Colletotrichum navitas]KAK1593273.1 hypothetical protein LY79DRAFT_579384 [Colletotrichum navitas]
MSLPPKCILLHLPVVRQTADDPRLLEYARATYSCPLCLGDAYHMFREAYPYLRLFNQMLSGYAGWHKQHPSGGLDIFGEVPSKGQKQDQDTKTCLKRNDHPFASFSRKSKDIASFGAAWFSSSSLGLVRKQFATRPLASHTRRDHFTTQTANVCEAFR